MFSLLPRCHGLLRVTEVDLHTGVDGELDVLGHLLALVPGDRPAKLGRQGQGYAWQTREVGKTHTSLHTR